MVQVLWCHCEGCVCDCEGCVIMTDDFNIKRNHVQNWAPLKARNIGTWARMLVLELPSWHDSFFNFNRLIDNMAFCVHITGF